MHWDIPTQVLLNALIVVPSGKLCLRAWRYFAILARYPLAETRTGTLLHYWELMFRKRNRTIRRPLVEACVCLKYRINRSRCQS
jgi:hypothetical protein